MQVESRSETGQRSWQKIVASYTVPDTWRSNWQVINTLGPYLVLWGLMLWSFEISYWLTLALALPAGGLLVRAFILFHDCCHGSFYKSRRANETLGVILGVLVFTPFYRWRHDHAVHHATAGNLDKRGVGDVPTWTVQEYLAAPWWKKAGYRIMRNPFFLFTVGATFLFVVLHRFSTARSGTREHQSVVYTNLGMLAVAAVMTGLFGFKAYALIQLPIIAVAAMVGVWMFYVQHQFEGVYWESQESWSFDLAGLKGSSFYKLPGVLQWFSGNIGFHHIHHLSPKIPNYLLPKCHWENPELQIKPLTMLGSLKSTRLHLWDEANRQLVGWNILRRRVPNS